MSEANEWYSEAANAKLAEVKRKKEAGEPALWSDLIGIAEPRVQPTADECCHNCEGDARPEGFGGGNLHYCGLCLNRDRDDEHDYEACPRTASAPVSDDQPAQVPVEVQP